MTAAVAVWPQAGAVHMSGEGYAPPLILTKREAIHHAGLLRGTNRPLAREIGACVGRLWLAERAA